MKIKHLSFREPSVRCLTLGSEGLPASLKGLVVDKVRARKPANKNKQEKNKIARKQ
jgi:hypothetical protein